MTPPSPSDRQIDSAYRFVWDTFCQSEATVDGRHDTEEWRAHTGPFALCVVRVDPKSIASELAELRIALRRVIGLRLHPDHFLHITLQELGFVVDTPSRLDEMTPARLEEFAQSVVGPASASRGFSLRLGGVNSFQDAVFLEVRDGGRLSQLHEHLFDLAVVLRQPAFPYLPHCTIGHYDDATPISDAIEAIAPWRDADLGEIRVSEIEVITLDLDQPYPELQSYAVIPFGG